MPLRAEEVRSLIRSSPGTRSQAQQAMAETTLFGQHLARVDLLLSHPVVTACFRMCPPLFPEAQRPSYTRTARTLLVNAYSRSSKLVPFIASGEDCREGLI